MVAVLYICFMVVGCQCIGGDDGVNGDGGGGSMVV